MRRAAFVAGAVAAAATPRALRAADLDLDDLVARIPGITGIAARTMDDNPVAVVRADERFPSASVIKCAIMATVYRAYDAGTARPSDTVALRGADLVGGSDALAGARSGQRLTLDALVRAMIGVSDNAASNALITAFGMQAINATMQLAGMSSSRLARHFADVVPSWRRSENLITPNDTATLLYEIERGAREGIATIASAPSCREMLDILLTNDDPTKIVRGLPPGTPCAHKTGEIDGVRNDAAVVDPFGDAPYVLVILTRNLRSTAAGDAGIAAIAHRIDKAVRTGSA